MTNERTEKGVYPWLKYELNLSRMDSTFWLTLGEIKSKIEHIALVPLRPDTARKINQIYLAKGVLSTTAIEGNTLSEEEVNQHLEGKLRLPPSRQYLQQEIENVVSACNSMGETIRAGESLYINSEEIMHLNAEILKNLHQDEGSEPGKIRKVGVGVGTYRAPDARDCKQLLQRLCDWLNSNEFEAADENQRVVFALIKAILAHLYLVWIHPFGDGNGRTARLLEFRILLSASIPWPVAHLLSNHYNLTRSEYYRILSASSRKKNGELLFLRYSVLGLRDQLKEQLELIWDQVWDVTWRNIVHENFSGENESLQRKRKLLLDLSVFQKKPDNEWVELSKLPNVSPRVARHYSKRTYRTVKRDVIDLIQKDFLKTNKGLFAVNRELILRFLPLRREE